MSWRLVYPRVCGGNSPPARRKPDSRGLSPRVRGKRRCVPALALPARSIPACAGETGASDYSPPSYRVYPRVCGGNHTIPPSCYRLFGLSPRVRGKPGVRRHFVSVGGSIPACAGETPFLAGSYGQPAVYPRVCGGNWPCCHRRQLTDGLSPRVRGKHPPAPLVATGCRSIPACAGETMPSTQSGRRRRVYPRVCGGNVNGIPTASPGGGLSPRVRGKRWPRRRRLSRRRSIPACAGETCIAAPSRLISGVYPRVCGGNGDGGGVQQRGRGLSPRVRGKQNMLTKLRRHRGSIPACAGETAYSFAGPPPTPVYPRVCGGNGLGLGIFAPCRGLSPRVRGKRFQRGGDIGVGGSIPACAGETPPAHAGGFPLRVYPRVCGGNVPPGGEIIGLRGLSPRVRGKHPAAQAGLHLPGSIPACAGETPTPTSPRPLGRVYPRVCGGNNPANWQAAP